MIFFLDLFYLLGEVLLGWVELGLQGVSLNPCLH